MARRLQAEALAKACRDAALARAREFGRTPKTDFDSVIARALFRGTNDDPTFKEMFDFARRMAKTVSEFHELVPQDVRDKVMNAESVCCAFEANVFLGQYHLLCDTVFAARGPQQKAAAEPSTVDEETSAAADALRVVDDDTEQGESLATRL